MTTLHVLVVAEHSDVLDSLVGELKKAILEGLSVHCVGSVTAAKRSLQSRRPNALILDHELTAGGAAAFARSVLRMGKRAPAVFIVGRLSDTNAEMAALVREHSEITFFERPFRPDVAARRIRSVLLPHSDPDQSFYGLRLCELIQAFCLSRHDATLTVITPDGRMGTVAVQSGQLVHVAFGDKEGMDAFLDLVEARKGEIRVVPDCLTARQTIDRPTQQVLIEVHRRLDEMRHDTAQSPAPSQSLENSTPGERWIMAELDALLITDEVEPPLPQAEKKPATQSSPHQAPSHPVRPVTPRANLVHATYRGLPPQTFPPTSNPRVGGTTGARSTSAPVFHPKNLSRKSVEDMLTEALEEKE